MDQLMQFISASLTDMTRGDRLLSTVGSSKPYKCALLDDRTHSSPPPPPPPSSDPSAAAAAAVNAGAAAACGTPPMATTATTMATGYHGHHICTKHEESNKDIVQQSQVSSTRSPSVLANDIIGPLLLEALDGFLFMVDNMGKIQFISENVTQYLKYTKDDLIGNNIYNLVHSEDYSHFTKSLELLSKESTSKSRTFSCRMNVKPPGEERDPCYDNMQITAILQPHPGDADSDKSSRCLLACIARRVGCVEKSTTSLGIEKFTTKQDLKGKILACDTSGGQKSGSHSYSKLIGENVQDFCHGNDRPQLLKHHREVIMNGSNTSGVYRFRLHENRYVFVQTKSKLFKNPMNGNPEFIMSTHSIVRECDTESELKGSASSCLMKAIIGNSGSKLSKDRIDMSSNKARQTAASAQPQSTMFDLEDLFNDPRLNFSDIADDSSFCDIPDLLPNPMHWSSLSDLSLDKGLSSGPGSPIGSIPVLSPATSASRSPRMGSVVQQGWVPKECRPPKQGRGRPRSSKKSTGVERVPSWTPSCSSTMSGGGSGQGNQGVFNVPAVTSQHDSKSKKNLLNPKSVGSYSSAGPSLTDSWENLYSSPSSADHFSTPASKKSGFHEVGFIQPMRQLQKTSRQRTCSGESSSSASWFEKLPPNVRGGNKNAHLLDLLMRDDDEEEDAGAFLLSPTIHHEGQSARTTTSVKSEHSDSEAAAGAIGSCSQPIQQPKQENEDEMPKCPPAKRPAMQNVILKQLLSQADEDSQPFKCDLKLVPAEPGASREVAQADVASQLASADSSAVRSVPSTDLSTLNASSEAEPKKEDDVLLKQLLNKEESFGQSRSSSPELLKSLLSNDDTSVQPAEAHSSEPEVASSGLSSPVAMEMSLPDHLSEFLSGGVKRKATEIEDATSNPAPFKFPSRSVSLTEGDGPSRGGDARGSKRKASGPTGPSKKNILLAQLLSKQVDNDPMVNMKNPSAIATVTPLMQMLQQSTGKADEPAVRNREAHDPSSVPTFENAENELTQLAGDSHSTEVPGVAKGRPLSCPGDMLHGDGRSHDALGLDEESDCLGLKDWANYSLGDLSPTVKCDDSTLKEFIQSTTTTEGGVLDTSQRQDSAPAEDLDRGNPNSPSEEDKKILAELEEVLESSRFTMEDLNSMLGISSGLALEPTKHSAKSAINALEEQVSRIDSNLKLQGGVDDRDGPDRGRPMAGHGWPGNEITDLGLLGDFDEVVATDGQRYMQMQGYPKRITESSALHPSNMFDPMTRPTSSASVASSPAYQRQALQQQQMFAQGQLQVNKPVLSSAVSKQVVEAINSNREEIFGDYTPISPALQDDVFSPGETFGFPQMTNTDLHPLSSTNYTGTPMSSLCSLEPSQPCSPKVGSTRCHSTQVNQFGPFFGGNLQFQSGMREPSERKLSRFVEHMNPGVNSMMNPAMGATLVDSGSGELGIFANQRNFNVMNQGGWNQMHVGQPEGNLMVNQRTVAQFNQTRLNLMSGSRVNEPSKANSPFYGPTMNPVRQMFKGSVNQNNASETINLVQMNQMNLGQMGQMSAAQMNMNQMSQMNIGQLNQINIRQMNQINVGQINQINVGQVNHINMSQMNPMGMGSANQINMGQMNLGQMNVNLGQMKAMSMGQMNHFDRMSRGNAFNPKAAASPEEFSHMVKTSKASLGSLDSASVVDRMASSRSKGHRSHLEFLPGNQSQVMDAAMIQQQQQQQRMNVAGMMNPTGLGMNFESIGMGINSGHMGHSDTEVMGQTGFMGQGPHPGLGRMTHSGMSSMNHPGLGHMNHMGSGGPMPCVNPTNPAAMKAATMNRVGHAHPMNHSGQVTHLHQVNLPCQTKPISSTAHGFMRPLELPGYGQSVMGQPQLGQSPMGQSPMGQSSMGQSSVGQSPMGQPQMSQPTLERVSQSGGMHGVTSSGFESPPELSMEDIFQAKASCDTDQFVGASVGGPPLVFGEGRQQGSYRMSDRQTLQAQSNVFAPEQQRHLSAQPSQDPLLLSPISNHSLSLEGASANKNPNIGRQGTSREAGKTMQRSLSEMSAVKETSSTREYIKQELRNMCTARAQQGHSLQQQMHQHQHLQPQQHLPQSASSSRLSTVPPGFDDEIPLDILESINEITKAQEKQQKLMTHNSNQPTSFEQAMAPRPQSKSRDPLLFTGENSHDPLGSDQFWDPLGGDELPDLQNPVLSFNGLFEPHLDSSRILPKMPANARMLNKSGSLLQKLLSDTT